MLTASCELVELLFFLKKKEKKNMKMRASLSILFTTLPNTVFEILLL